MFVIGIKTLLTTDTKEKTTSISSYYPIYTNEKWGVINEKGEIVIEPTYDEMITIPDSKTDVFICMQNVNYELNTYTVKVLNSKNKEIFTNYDIVEAIENTDNDNNMWYEDSVLKVKKGDLYGLIDFSGKEILAPSYDKIEPLIGIKNSFILTKDGQLGLCDNKGNIIINTEYKEIKGIGTNYQNGYIVVNNEDKYGIIDFNSKIILNAEYEDIKQVVGNNIYIVKEKGKWEAINSNKDVLVSDKFDDVIQINSDRLLIVKNKKYGVITSSGEEIIKPQYDDMSYLFGNYYIAKSKGNYGVIDTSNETILKFEYSAMSYQNDGEFIIADKNGQIEQEVYNNKFEKKLEGIISEVNTKYILVYIDGQYKYYNLKFEETTAQQVLTSNTLFLSKKDGKYGYVDKDGNVVVDYIYDDATEQNAYGYVCVNENGKWGSIDKNGKIVQQPIYELNDYLVIDFIGKWHLANDLNSHYYTDKK